MNELIDQANKEWDELHPDEEESERLLPLIRLRVTFLSLSDSERTSSLSHARSHCGLAYRLITLEDPTERVISKLGTHKDSDKISLTKLRTLEI